VRLSASLSLDNYVWHTYVAVVDYSSWFICYEHALWICDYEQKTFLSRLNIFFERFYYEMPVRHNQVEKED
jgi:hypothetical protein